MGTLFVVGSPAGGLNDLTLRARRTLAEVSLVLSDDIDCPQILAQYNIATPVLRVGEPATAASIEQALKALRAGDVAFLTGWRLASTSGSGQQMIRAARGSGFSVQSVPNAILPIPSLILSGLPTNTFVFLGLLPEKAEARQLLLHTLTAERRTLVTLIPPDYLTNVLEDLDILGDRPLVALAHDDQGGATIWRGTIKKAQEQLPLPAAKGEWELVIGGASGGVEPWSESRLLASIQALRDTGLATKEIGRRLARESGWPRREIYRRAATAHTPQRGTAAKQHANSHRSQGEDGHASNGTK
jgi:16S rRNA (cytidine1402-2'-O)-methyltransferase